MTLYDVHFTAASGEPLYSVGVHAPTADGAVVEARAQLLEQSRVKVPLTAGATVVRASEVLKKAGVI